MSVSAAIAVTTPGESLQRMMVEMNRLVRIIGKRDEDASDDKALSLDSINAVERELDAYDARSRAYTDARTFTGRLELVSLTGHRRSRHEASRRRPGTPRGSDPRYVPCR